MDIAKAFAPNTILLWRRVADHPEAQRIVGMFPKAELRVVEHQRGALPSQHSTKHPIVIGKRILMIGETTSFMRRFDGCLGSSVCCSPYFKLVPISNGCPYYCIYCYLAYVYRDYQPFIKLNINHGKMFEEIRESALQAQGAAAFNMGEMLDSLALDHVSLLAEQLVPFFGRLSNAHGVSGISGVLFGHLITG